MYKKTSTAKQSFLFNKYYLNMLFDDLFSILLYIFYNIIQITFFISA